MEIETIKLESDVESEYGPGVTVYACDDGYSVSVTDGWGDTACVSLSFEEAEKLARLFTQHITN